MFIMKKALNKIGNKLVVDGIYGDKTKEAVKRLQKEAKITIDGVYGNNTANALQKCLQYKYYKRTIQRGLGLSIFYE